VREKTRLKRRGTAAEGEAKKEPGLTPWRRWRGEEKGEGKPRAEEERNGRGAYTARVNRAALPGREINKDRDMEKLKRQIDFQVAGLHVREADGEGKRRTVEGYAVVFGVRSVNLTPWSTERSVYEIMEPGCIDQALLQRSDVVLTAFHNNQMILGRWRQGKGTLSLSVDAHGLRCTCTLAETATADELLTAIERGDITGMSFAFLADEEDSENGVSYERTNEREGEKVVWLRHVWRVTGLYDVTIAGHPDYEQTSIEAREVAKAIETALESAGTTAQGSETGESEAEERESEKSEAKTGEKRETESEKEEAERMRALEEAERRARRRHMSENYLIIS